ncbi:MAG: homoserine dehydrogenase [Chloroflexota bacterium]|nr:homoserine dehydrogenase [Chloroflexota bacterium]
MKIGIIGIGNVGLQVLKDIQSNRKINNFLNIEKILVRDKDKYLKILESEFGADSPVLEKLTDDYNNFINSDIDTVVELIGGSSPAKEYVNEALNYKKNVVTANKEIIASSIEDLTSSANLNKVKIRFEAAVGAGIPLIEVLIDMLKQNKISKITGIINGTSNYILSSMHNSNKSFDESLKEAQKLGFAESDPTNDIGGFDAVYKLSILGSIAFGGKVPIESISVKGIENLSQKDISYSNELGFVIKLLAVTENKSSKIYSNVAPYLVPENHPLAKVNDNYNAIEINGDLVGNLWFQGQGAGKLSTTSAVIGDLIGIKNSTSGSLLLEDKELNFLSDDEIVGKKYIRLNVEDKFGVLEKIAGIFSRNKVSIASVIQKEVDKKGLADLVIMTHESKGNNLKNSLDEIQKLNFIKEDPTTFEIYKL